MVLLYLLKVMTKIARSQRYDQFLNVRRPFAYRRDLGAQTIGPIPNRLLKLTATPPLSCALSEAYPEARAAIFPSGGLIVPIVG